MTNINLNDKVIIQELIEFNTSIASGDFHSNSLDVDGLVKDISKKFKIIPLNNDLEESKTLKNLIEISTVKVRGRFNSKELKQSVFFKHFSKNFKIQKS